MRPQLTGALPRFGVRLGLAALASVGAWWLLSEPFGAAFRMLGNLVVVGLGGSGKATFVPVGGTKLFEPDAHILFMRSGKVIRAVDMVSLRVGYIPLAVACGLAFAARQWKPIHWRRLLLALAAVIGYTGLTIGIVVLHFGLARPPVAFGSFAALEAVAGLAFAIVALPGFQYAIPAVIWYACTASLSVQASNEHVRRKASRRRTATG